MEDEYRMQKAKEVERKNSFSHEEGSTGDAAMDEVGGKLEDVSLTDDADPAVPSIKIDRTSLERPPQSAEEDPKVNQKGI